MDRRTAESGRRKGGGLTVFVNNRWCNPGHITVKKQICSRDIELLAVRIWPYYLPCDLSHVIMLAVYIPPANTAGAREKLQSTVSQLQTKQPQALILISGDLPCTALCHSVQLHTVMLTGTQGTIKLWTGCMQTSRMESSTTPTTRPLRLQPHPYASSVHTVSAEIASTEKAGKVWTGGAAEGPLQHHGLGRSLQPTRGGHHQCNRLHHRLHKLLCGKHFTIQCIQQQVLGDPRSESPAEGEEEGFHFRRQGGAESGGAI